MNVLFILGSIPPEKCGVADYTNALSLSINKISGVSSKLKKSTSFKSFFKIIKDVDVDVVHLQYPTVGHKKSLIPLLIPFFFKKKVLTIHEFSNVHWLRRLYVFFLTMFFDRVIFTNNEEKLKYENYFPISFFMCNDRSVINIGPSVKMSFEEDNKKDLIYFGLARKNKGLEEFLDFCVETDVLKFVKVKIICAVPDDSINYYKTIRNQYKILDVSWLVDLDLAEVSKHLSCAKYSYLHFPDGISFRRSSFITLIEHNIIVFSNEGVSTPLYDLNKLYTKVKSFDDILREILGFENNISVYQNALNTIKKEKEIFSWDSIAKKHVDLYKKDFI